MSRDLIWMGSSEDDIAALPRPVKMSFGYRLRQLREHKEPANMKPLPQFGSGEFELRERFDTNAFRLVYIVKLKNAIYVLHVFMKKSKTGIGFPKPDANVILERLKRAREMDAENINE